ncbi:MAG: fused MFS/spermidine synthase [Acidobacteriota bacterium]
MNATPSAFTQPTSGLRPYLPLLVLLFIGSGCAALIYEIVWFQLLQLAIGSSAVSLGVLLGTFMGGMCLGSLLLPRLVAESEHPLKVYAKIELGIGVLGLVILFVIPLMDRVYAGIASFGWTGVTLRALIAALCLLPPTFLMGASLPAIARWIEATPQGVSWLGFFYGGNIAGAVLGCLLAGFYLLRVYDMGVATYVAVAINVAVGLLAWQLSSQAVYTRSSKSGAAAASESPNRRAVFLVIAISGMCALGAEVIWTRLLSMMMGATVYTFSIILAVFLIGLGIGSSVGSVLARNQERARTVLGWAQLLAVGGIAWTAYMLADSLPYWPVNPLLASSPWFNFQIDLARALWTVLPPALMWGASFPLAMSAVSTPGGDTARVAGETYAANTVGAILGALLFSVVFVPWLGTQDAQRLLMGLAMAAAVIALVPTLKLSLRGAGQTAAAAVLILSLGGGVALMRGLSAVPWLPLAYGRRAITTLNAGEPLYVGEGMNSSIVISQLPAGQRYFHVSGKVEASTEPFDMRLQRMLGHISALAHKDPKSVLVVGFGAGVTAGSFTTYSSINRIVICELEALIPPAATKFFGAENYGVLNDKRTEVQYDDARHFILTSAEKFDVITSDPIHPWVKGAATLYSKEYFELAKQHLKPGGVITQWVPLYESDLDTVKSEIATFFDVFPNATIWANNVDGEGYDVVLLGQAEPTKIDMDGVQQRLARDQKAADSLSEVGIKSATDLFGTYAGSASEMRQWLAGAAINRDLNLRLQYLAGMGANNQGAGAIMREISQYRKFPAGLFTGSPETLARLQEEIQN